jgi:predicted lipoprotein with Yx(FWY)xxD motif
MDRFPGSRPTSVVLKLGGPVAASGVVAAACSSGGPQALAPSTPAPTIAATTSSASTDSSTSTVDVRASVGKTFLTDGSGRSLYLWTLDTHTESMCSGTCATAWPPLTAKGFPTAGNGVIAGDLGTINRADGTKQVTYAAAPQPGKPSASSTGGSNAGGGY